MKRRDFFKLGAATPFVRLPEVVPCHEQKFVEMGEFAVVHLVAGRERYTPEIEIEMWSSDMKTCAVCGEAFMVDRKTREPFDVGHWLLAVPPGEFARRKRRDQDYPESASTLKEPGTTSRAISDLDSG